jgi:hypothetical protein
MPFRLTVKCGRKRLKQPPSRLPAQTRPPACPTRRLIGPAGVLTWGGNAVAADPRRPRPTPAPPVMPPLRPRSTTVVLPYHYHSNTVAAKRPRKRHSGLAAADPPALPGREARADPRRPFRATAAAAAANRPGSSPRRLLILLIQNPPGASILGLCLISRQCATTRGLKRPTFVPGQLSQRR